MKLEIKSIDKSFGEKHVLNGVSLTAESGRALGLLGRNGAGKTTTIRIIMGIFPAESGEVLLDGRPIDRGKIKIGYLPEERGLYPKKPIGTQLCYIGALMGLTKNEAASQAKQLLDRVGLADYYNRRLETLSKGNQQKIQLAATLIGNPQILILDEPFSGLDPVNAQLLKDIVKEQVAQDKIVLFSSHQMGYIEEFCENIAILNGGRIVLDGNLKEIKRNSARDQLYIELEEKAAPELFSSALHASPNGDGWTVTLRSLSEKDALLRELVSKNLHILKFEVVEPTLEEIFVKKAGSTI